MDSIQLLVADAQYLTRLGMRYLIQQTDKLEVAGEAGREEELVRILQEKKIDVVVLDHYQSQNFSVASIDLIREISPDSGILVITSDTNRQNIYKLLENGITSLLTKYCDHSEIIEAIHATYKKEKFFCGKILEYILEKSFGKPTSDCSPTPLTPREIEIVQLIAKGKIAKEIAEELNLSPHTIYTHRKNIMKKLAFSSSSELVLYAVNNGWVSI
jgi:DNA-binding NarL/FixJ family response regulator